MVHINLSGENFDEAIATFTETYSIAETAATPSDEKFSWSHRARGDDTLTLRANRFMATMETTLGADGDFIAAWARSGRITFDGERSPVEIPPQVPFMLPGAGSPRRSRSTDTLVNLVHVDRDFLLSVAEEIGDVRFVAFRGIVPTSTPNLHSWRRAVGLTATVVGDTTELEDSLLGREVARVMSIAMLSTFPYDSVARTFGAAGSEPVAVHEAHEFVYHNAHLPIGPADIARAVGLSVRSLQHALRRYRETTPTALLQSVRLEYVQRDLLAAHPLAGAVAIIARRWGFTHLGRFSVAYRARFGESPGTTIRHSAPVHRLPPAKP